MVEFSEFLSVKSQRLASVIDDRTCRRNDSEEIYIKFTQFFHVLTNVINHFPVYGSWVHMYVGIKERNNSSSYHQLNEQLESIYVGILLAKYTTYGVLLIFPFVYKNKILKAVRFLLSSDLFTIFFHSFSLSFLSRV